MQERRVPSDPVERILFDGLLSKGIDFIMDGEGDTRNLDFYLKKEQVYIEVTAYSTERKNKQMKRSKNIILIQGRHAARMFIRMIHGSTEPIEVQDDPPL